MAMKKRLLAPLLVIIIVAAAIFIWCKEGMLPVNSTDTNPRVFAIEKGQTINTIINNLQNNGLIRNRIVFYGIVKLMKIDRLIQAGDYKLNPSMSAQEIAQTLTHGTQDRWVTVVEGLRKEEIAQLLAQSHGIETVAFITDASEGKLFPDTYRIPTTTTAKELVALMTNNFVQKAQSELVAAATARKLTQQQALTLASLLEREAKSYEDRRVVAGILLNRLAIDMPLQVDATVQYALGFDEAANTWWKKDLTFDDLKIDSPFNTYLNTGLPPSPICNPGLNSLRAITNAVSSKYLFYLTDKHGVMHYATTLEEHNANVKKYL